MITEAQPLIVIVEDEEPLATVISTHLENAGMKTQICLRSIHALKFLQNNFANLVLLDLNIPDKSGFGLLADLKKEGINVPTIFVTANADELNKIKGLEMGADDYVTKPFSYAELTARIRAVLRRTEGKDDLKLTDNLKVTDAPFEFNQARVLPDRMEVTFSDGSSEPIGRKELGILFVLASQAGVVLPRKALIHAVWGEHADVKSRSLDQYIVKIRELYRRHGLELDSFRTVHGVGYIYEPKKD